MAFLLCIVLIVVILILSRSKTNQYDREKFKNWCDCDGKKKSWDEFVKDDKEIDKRYGKIFQ